MSRASVATMFCTVMLLGTIGCTSEVSQAEQKAQDIVAGRKADSAARRGICTVYQESGKVIRRAHGRTRARGGSYLDILTATGRSGGGGGRVTRHFSRTKGKTGAIHSDKKWVDEQASWARKKYSAEASTAFVRILEGYLSSVSNEDLEVLCSGSAN